MIIEKLHEAIPYKTNNFIFELGEEEGGGGGRRGLGYLSCSRFNVFLLFHPTTKTFFHDYDRKVKRKVSTGIVLIITDLFDNGGHITDIKCYFALICFY